MDTQQIQQNMALFQELALCGDSIYTWCYDSDGTLLSSNCPDETVLGAAFVHFQGRELLQQHLASRQSHLPVMIGTAIGLMWYASCQWEDGVPARAWVLGPVFYRSLSVEQVEDALRDYAGQADTSVRWKMRFFDAIRNVPVASNILMQRYVLMLHYCLTGERLAASDICHGVTAPDIAAPRGGQNDRHRVYMSERAMLDTVRNGDLDYSEALSRSMSISTGVPVEGKDALRQAKTSAVVFVTLVCRAAMEGGLSPETAYSLGDGYIQAAEDARTMDEISSITQNMYVDYIQRVHALRAGPGISPEIRRCCDYIEMNTDKKLQARDLARVAGYSEYYLTRRFQREMGVSFNDYVKAARIERAKTLLTTTDDSTAEIAAKLCFGSRSYFSQVFTALVGMSPQAYRESHA